MAECGTGTAAAAAAATLHCLCLMIAAVAAACSSLHLKCYGREMIEEEEDVRLAWIR